MSRQSATTKNHTPFLTLPFCVGLTRLFLKTRYISRAETGTAPVQGLSSPLAARKLELNTPFDPTLTLSCRAEEATSLATPALESSLSDQQPYD